jgi:hypothetical protein
MSFKDLSDKINTELKFIRPPLFGDPLSESRYVQTCDAQARSTLHILSVAPMCAVTSLWDRREVKAGEEIQIRDVDNARTLDELVRLGVVIRIPATTAAARRPVEGSTHRVTQLSAVSSRTRGILDCGSYCSAADWAEPPRASYADKVTGTIEPGRPASDGTAAIAELVSRGLLEPIESAKTPSKSGKAA